MRSPIMKHFTYAHLPEHVQFVSRECALLADTMEALLPPADPEKHAGLRKLMEAKDCFVRAYLSMPKDQDANPGG